MYYVMWLCCVRQRVAHIAVDVMRVCGAATRRAGVA